MMTFKPNNNSTVAFLTSIDKMEALFPACDIYQSTFLIYTEGISSFDIAALPYQLKLFIANHLKLAYPSLKI